MKGSLTAAGWGRRRGLRWHRPGAASPLREGGGEVASGERPRARPPLPRPCPRCRLRGEALARRRGTGEKGEDRPQGLEAVGRLPPRAAVRFRWVIPACGRDRGVLAGCSGAVSYRLGYLIASKT